jgi:hypothetical protein
LFARAICGKQNRCRLEDKPQGIPKAMAADREMTRKGDRPRAGLVTDWLRFRKEYAKASGADESRQSERVVDTGAKLTVKRRRSARNDENS